MIRVYVVCNCNFPRGGALANYMQYLLLGIKEAGYPVTLISDTNSEFVKNTASELFYEGIRIFPILISPNRVLRHLQNKNGFSRKRIAILKQEKISSEDVVIVLGRDKYFYTQLIKLREKIGFKIVGGVLELFEEVNMAGRDKQDKHKRYKIYKYILDDLIPQFDMVIPISTYIEEYYKRKKVRTTCIPIMADPSEFETVPKTRGKYKIIIPANGMMKDALPAMMKAVAALSEFEKKNIEVHLCGIKEVQLEVILGKEELSAVKDVITVHSWMEYGDLVALYQQMHFLLLARDTSQMTLANFPSKVPETMGFGIVPIVSDVGDYTKYYLQDKVNSIFIDGSSKEACLAAIRAAISLSWDRYLEYSTNARKCVEEKFDYRVWTPTIQHMIESLFEL